MHRKRVPCELHDSYFCWMTINHAIPKTEWAIEWALNYYITQSRQKSSDSCNYSWRRSYRRVLVMFCLVSSSLSHANLEKPFWTLTIKWEVHIFIKKSSCVCLLCRCDYDAVDDNITWELYTQLFMRNWRCGRFVRSLSQGCSEKIKKKDIVMIAGRWLSW